MPPALWVTTSDELSQALDLLSGSDFVAIDTEFMRERTYYASLCLIQLATPDACAIVDPLALVDRQPLWHFLADRKRLKVLHSGRQDMEVLSLAMTPPTAGELPALTIPGPLFDTQVAAALLGSPAQVGYATLVSERLGFTLPKAHTRADWSRRPLSPEQLEYAADDVRYLVPLYLELVAALTARERSTWQDEEMRELENPALYRVDPVDAWRRLKGLDRLQPIQRATLKVLAQWREARAMLKDKPRGWILTDELLREIAERRPSNRDEVAAIQGLSANFLRKRTEEVLEMVIQGQRNAPQEAPAIIPAKPDPQLTARVNKLLTVVREEAQRSNIAPELLATRRDVEQLVFGGRTDHLLQGWRRDAIGQRLVTLATA